MTTTADEFTRAQAEAEQADAMATEARRRMSEATRAADAERQARRRQVWQKHLAEIERADHPARIRQARAELTAAIRGNGADSLAAFRQVLVAERQAAIDHEEARQLRSNLGIPDRSTPLAGRIVMDPDRPFALLVEILEAETVRAVQAVQDRRRSEIMAAWEGDGQPPARRLDPSRHRYLQDQVSQISSLIQRAETQHSQWLEISEGEDIHARETQERSRTEAKRGLADLRVMLTEAREDLAAFEAGRT